MKFFTFVALILNFSLVQAAVYPVEPALRKRIVTELTQTLNTPSNPLRKQLVDHYSGCQDQWSSCIDAWQEIQEHGAAKFKFTEEFVRSRIKHLHYSSSSSEDNCPKGECTPATSGEHEYLVFWHESNSMKWSSGTDSVLIISAQVSYDDQVLRGAFKFAPFRSGL